MRALLLVSNLLSLLLFANGTKLPSRLSQVDPSIFDFVKLDVLVFDNASQTDETLEGVKQTFDSSRFFISTKSNTKCDGRELRIATRESISTIPRQSRFKFHKNPCENIVIFDKSSLLESEVIKEQPYYYSFEGNNIVEVQSYAKTSKIIAKFNHGSSSIEYFWTDLQARRSDFNGASIITNHMLWDKLFFDYNQNGEMVGEDGELLELFKRHYNFSISWYPGPQIFGTKPKTGPWGGYVGALLNGTLDFSGIPMYHTLNRIDVVSPGRPRDFKKTPMFYRRHVGVVSRLLSIFQVFTEQLWLVIGSSLVIFTVFLAQGNPRKMLQALNQVVQALLGQAELNNSKWIWYRFLTFFLALYGSLLYWSYSGMLISNLTVAKQDPPFQTIAEFLTRPNMKIHTQKGTAAYGMVLQSVGPEKENELRERLDASLYTNENDLQVYRNIFNSSGLVTDGIFSQPKYFYSRLNKAGFDNCEVDSFHTLDIPKIAYGYMYPFDSMLQPLFDKYMMDLITYGITDEITSKYGNKASDCTQPSNFQSVNFGFVQILFIVLTVGATTGLIILAFELLSK